MRAPDDLTTINTYCDTAPRATANAETIGPFTLFVARTGWPFYARPAVDLRPDHAFDVAEIAVVVERQRALGIPLTFEWVHELAPALAAAAGSHGLDVTTRPLLVQTVEIPSTGTVEDIVMLEPEDDRFGAARSAVAGGFEETDSPGPEPGLEAIRQRAREELLRVAGAFDTSGAAVGGGSASARGDVAELTGIAVLPRARGRGIGAAITAVLAADARARGVRTVWLSATDERVAAVYERVGFTRIGTTYEAAPRRSGGSARRAVGRREHGPQRRGDDVGVDADAPDDLLADLTLDVRRGKRVTT